MSRNNSLNSIKDEIDKKVKIVVVSKTRSKKEILDIYNKDHRDFGENKVQEILEKHEKLPKDIRWHFIGHLQTNKVKYIIPFISLVHSVDSLKLLEEINKRAKAKNKIIKCLIQVKIANEESKYGFKINEISDVMNYASELEHILIKGLMGMATNTDNNNLIDREFKLLNTEFKKYKSKIFNVLSMGMSNDYILAISNESNMLRLGSIIWGKKIIMKKKIFTANAPAAIGPYSQAILSNETLYCSGQIALDIDGNLQNSNIEDETFQIFKNINAILKEVNMTFENIVKSTIFLKNMDDFSTVNTVYAKHFKSTPPARETVEVSRLPKNVNIEISVIAVK